MKIKKSVKKKYWLWIIIITSVVFVTNIYNENNTPTFNNNAGELANELDVYFLDVDQGDATLFKGDDFTILIDAGRHDNDDVIEYLMSLGVTDIDLLVGTHPHTDHIGQMDDVIKAFSVSEVWMSGNTSSSQTFENLIDTINDNDIKYYEPRAGEDFQISSMNIKVIHPSNLTEDMNNDSLSLLMQYGDIRFLFTGDAEESAENEILDRSYDIDTDIFQAGHHGSSSSNTPNFIDEISPEVVIYSAGVDNSYGHPHDEVIKGLRSRNIDIYGTDIYGTIKVTTDGKTYRIDNSYAIQ